MTSPSRAVAAALVGIAVGVGGLILSPIVTTLAALILIALALISVVRAPIASGGADGAGAQISLRLGAAFGLSLALLWYWVQVLIDTV